VWLAVPGKLGGRGRHDEGGKERSERVFLKPPTLLGGRTIRRQGPVGGRGSSIEPEKGNHRHLQDKRANPNSGHIAPYRTRRSVTSNEDGKRRRYSTWSYAGRLEIKRRKCSAQQLASPKNAERIEFRICKSESPDNRKQKSGACLGEGPWSPMRLRASSTGRLRSSHHDLAIVRTRLRQRDLSKEG